MHSEHFGLTKVYDGSVFYSAMRSKRVPQSAQSFIVIDICRAQRSNHRSPRIATYEDEAQTPQITHFRKKNLIERVKSDGTISDPKI